MIVGIAGGSGSGKSTLAHNLMDALCNRKTVLIQQDAYYKDQSELPVKARENVNYDCPDALYVTLLVCHLNELISGGPIERPIYDFATHTRKKGCEVIYPAEIIFIEGILIFSEKSLRDLIDLKVFLDIAADVRLARRILRDVRERGRRIETVIEQWFDTVIPMHEMHVAPTKRYADITLTKAPSQDDLDMLIKEIRGHL